MTVLQPYSVEDSTMPARLGNPKVVSATAEGVTKGGNGAANLQ